MPCSLSLRQQGSKSHARSYLSEQIMSHIIDAVISLETKAEKKHRQAEKSGSNIHYERINCLLHRFFIVTKHSTQKKNGVNDRFGSNHLIKRDLYATGALKHKEPRRALEKFIDLCMHTSQILVLTPRQSKARGNTLALLLQPSNLRMSETCTYVRKKDTSQTHFTRLHTSTNTSVHKQINDRTDSSKIAGSIEFSRTDRFPPFERKELINAGICP